MIQDQQVWVRHTGDYAQMMEEEHRLKRNFHLKKEWEKTHEKFACLMHPTKGKIYVSPDILLPEDLNNSSLHYVWTRKDN